MARIKDRIPRVLYRGAEIVYNIQSFRAVRRAIRRLRPDFVYERYACFNFGCILAAKRAELPVILEVNTPYATAWDVYDTLYFKRTARRVEDYVLRQADEILVVSTPLKDMLVEQGVSETKVTVVPNGADPEKFRPDLDGADIRKLYGISAQAVIGFVGILRPWHGVDLLLRVFSEIHKQHRLHLLIVGDGPLEDELKQMSQELVIADHVTFCGRIAHHEMARHIAAMDVAVSPRAAPHASPMKILEYMAMGVPVVAPRMPNIQDIVKDGVEALLFQPEDSESFANALLALVNNADLRSRLARNARGKIENKLNWMNNAKHVAKLAEALVSAQP